MPDTDAETLIDKAAKEAASDAISRIKAAANADGEMDWSIRVTRVTGASKLKVPEPELFECLFEDLEGIPDRLRREFGNGRYRVRVRLNNSPFAQYDIAIELPIGAAQPMNNAEAGLLAPLREMMEQQQRFFQSVLDRLAPSQQADPLERAILLVDKIRGGAAAPAVQDVTTQFEKVMEIAEKFNDRFEQLAGKNSGGDTSGFGGILRELISSEGAKNLLGAVTEMIQRATPPAQTAQPQQPMRRMATPLAPVEQARQLTPEMFEAGEIPPALRHGIAYLIENAQKGGQPKIFAEWLETFLPEPVMNYLERQPSLIDYLIDKFPGVEPHRKWFESLINEIWEPAEQADVGQRMGDGAARDQNSAAQTVSAPGRNGGSARDAQTHAPNSARVETPTH